MYTQINDEIHKNLEQMWMSDSQYVCRMLIGLTRDIDLADDLLQETYLKAGDGMAGQGFGCDIKYRLSDNVKKPGDTL